MARNTKVQNRVKSRRPPDEQQFYQLSLKSPDLARWDEYISRLTPLFLEVWKWKTRKKWAESRFRIYRLKRRVLDRFFRTMQRPGQASPTIAYGNAKFPPNGRGELSAPTTSVGRACARHFVVHMVDEFRSSKVCFLILLFRSVRSVTTNFIPPQHRQWTGTAVTRLGASDGVVPPFVLSPLGNLGTAVPG
jgi:hypothetical protein